MNSIAFDILIENEPFKVMARDHRMFKHLRNYIRRVYDIDLKYVDRLDSVLGYRHLNVLISMDGIETFDAMMNKEFIRMIEVVTHFTDRYTVFIAESNNTTNNYNIYKSETI